MGNWHMYSFCYLSVIFTENNILITMCSKEWLRIKNGSGIKLVKERSILLKCPECFFIQKCITWPVLWLSMWKRLERLDVIWRRSMWCNWLISFAGCTGLMYQCYCGKRGEKLKHPHNSVRSDLDSKRNA